MLVSEMISDIGSRDLVLPEFQREYVWSREQAKQLLVSLTQKYPVGRSPVLEDPGTSGVEECKGTAVQLGNRSG